MDDLKPFAAIQRVRRPPGKGESKKALRTKIERFIDYFNRTMAKPFRWTYTGKPLAGAAK
jgi:hypothetical protein